VDVRGGIARDTERERRAEARALEPSYAPAKDSRSIPLEDI
jgi:hypothetical protein